MQNPFEDFIYKSPTRPFQQLGRRTPAAPRSKLRQYGFEIVVAIILLLISIAAGIDKTISDQQIQDLQATVTAQNTQIETLQKELMLRP